jgi:hypothetical protein
MSKRVDFPQGTIRPADAPPVATAETAAASAPVGLPKSAPATEAPKPDWAALTRTLVADAAAATQTKLEPPAAAKEQSAAPRPKLGKQADELSAQGGKPQTSRFALLATAVAGAAVLGSLIGSLASAGLSGIWAISAPDSGFAQSKTLTDSVAQLSSQVAALRASLEAANRTATTQLTRMADRFDRAERSQSDLSAKFAKISETVDRLDHRPATPVPAAATAGAPDTTGSIPDNRAAQPADVKMPGKTVDGWFIRDVYRGHALVESPLGAFDVIPGTQLPGLGRVENVLRQDGRWIVVTPKGLITSMR